LKIGLAFLLLQTVFSAPCLYMLCVNSRQSLEDIQADAFGVMNEIKRIIQQQPIMGLVLHFCILRIELLCLRCPTYWLPDELCF